MFILSINELYNQRKIFATKNRTHNHTSLMKILLRKGFGYYNWFPSKFETFQIFFNLLRSLKYKLYHNLGAYRYIKFIIKFYIHVYIKYQKLSLWSYISSRFYLYLPKQSLFMESIKCY